MDKLFRQLKALQSFYSERKALSTVFLSIPILLITLFLVYKKVYLNEEKAGILLLIARTHIENLNYETAIFGDTINVFHDLPKEIKGDSIAFYGLNEIQKSPRLRRTTAGKLSNYFLGICYYNLAENEKKEEEKKEYYYNAIKYFDKCKSKNESFSSRVYENLGDAFWQIGQEETAFEYYQNALKYENNISKISLLKKAAQLAKRLEKNKLALDYYNQIKSDFPNSISAKDIDKYINEISN